MSPDSRFREANTLAREKAGELGKGCLVVFQTGSSLRKEDFSPWSDVDLLAVYKEKPEDRWKSDYEGDVDVSVMQESEESFLENLEKGRSFELTALGYGKVLKGNDYVSNLRKKDCRPQRLTFVTWLQSALNHYARMLSDRDMIMEFYNSAYHSYREFSRYLILHSQDRFVEGDLKVKEGLKEMSPRLAERFWDLRAKRFGPLSLQEGNEGFHYIEISELEETELYQEFKKVESIGENVFRIEGLQFPSFERLKARLKKKGYNMDYAPLTYFREGEESRKEAIVSGRKKESGELGTFVFDMETGTLRDIEK